MVTTEMTCSKSTYATVCQTVLSKPFVDALLDHDEGKLCSEITTKCRNVGTMYVMLHEVLFS